MELRSATHPHYYRNNKHVACWSTYDDLFKKKNEKLAVDRCLEATVAPWYTTGQTIFNLRPSSNLLRRSCVESISYLIRRYMYSFVD